MDMSFTIVLMFLILLNVLMLIIKKPLLSLLVGLVTISIVAFSFDSVTYAIAFHPYMQVLTFVVCIGCMILSWKVS